MISTSVPQLQLTHCPLCIPGMVSPVDDCRPPAVIFLGMDGVMIKDCFSAPLRRRIVSTLKQLFPGIDHKDYHWTIAKGHHLDPSALTNLHELIDRIERAGLRVLIVISSQWGNDATALQLREEAFIKHRFSKYIAGKTAPDSTDARWTPECKAGHDSLAPVKEKYDLKLQVEDWLQGHNFNPETSNYIVIDDCPFSLPQPFGKRFIQTRTLFHKQDLEAATAQLFPSYSTTPSEDGIIQVTNGIHACQISAEPISAALRRYVQQNRSLQDSYLTKPPIIVQALDLSNLRITPALLEQLTQLFPSVTSITLCGTGIDDAAISFLAKFKQLKKLDISRNEKIKGASFNKLPQTLLELNCCFCTVSDQGIAHLATSTPQLQKLNVAGNVLFCGTGITALPKTLLELDCSYCYHLVSDQGIAHLATSTPQLQKLNVAGNELFCGTCITGLPETLIELICSSCGINDSCIVFHEASQIQRLNIGWNKKITGGSFKTLPQTLLELECENCDIVDSALSFLATRTPNLQKLDISRNERIAGATFNTLPQTLRELNCRRCSVTDQSIGFLAVSTPQLQRLNITSISQVTGSSFNRLPATLLELDCLDCSIDDLAIIPLGINARKLQKLNISCNKKITGETFNHLPPTLVELWCCSCLVTDENIGRLGTSTPKLQILNIFSNEKITGKTFDRLPRTLTSLDCHECSIDDTAIALLATSTPTLQKLDISVHHRHRSRHPITGATFNALPQTLVEFDCSCCSVEDQSIAFLATSTPQLKKLTVHANRLITGKTFNKLPQTLVEFDCSYCSVEDQSIAFLATSTPQLHKLNIRCNGSITGQIYAKLPQSLGILMCDRRFSQIEGLPFQTLRPSF